MNIEEVPQDPLHYKERDKIKKLMYAVGKDGQYTGVNSVGWEAENTATEQAWNEVEESLAKTEARVKSGELSPVAYFMEKCLMDMPLLAKYAGKWQWQVKKHLKPEGFKKLDKSMLEKYARIFNVSVDALVNFGKEK
ncbi:hypothetical protein ACTHGU_18125 [Chitinophagaceae bacterium MMS25-I14]